MKQYAVIGSGYFGRSVACRLKELGHEVLLIEKDETLVQKAVDNHIVTQAVCMDATNFHSLEEIGLASFDGVVIAIGEDIQASILTALNLVELGISNIIAKASTPAHGKILEKLNIHHVIYPEQEMGERVAQMLVQTNIWDGFILDKNHSVIEVTAGPKIISKSLKQLSLRNAFSINVIALKRTDQTLVIPSPDHYIQENDRLFVFGENKKLDKFVHWNDPTF